MKNFFRKIVKGDSGKDPFVPPRSLQFVGEADYVQLGEKFLRFFIDLGGLKPHHKVLDVGSGNARMAYPLRHFLDAGKGAEYHGQEIVKKAVSWCSDTYREYPHFHFFHADIYSKRYNPTGRQRSSEYLFPFDEGYFDFIFLTSVFTHMLKEDVQQYLKEISRLLTQGGTAFITAFLIDEESGKLLEQGKSDMAFVAFRDGMLTTVPENPENAVAFPYTQFMEMMERAGLQLARPVNFGRWSGRQEFTAYQDIIVATKI